MNGPLQIGAPTNKPRARFITVPVRSLTPHVKIEPGFVPIAPATAVKVRPLLIARPEPAEDHSMSAAINDDDGESADTDAVIDEFLVRGKKRRLDHLSWEEKFQRKKLKNRVAAQTSRDRKKARMEEIEHSLQLLSERNDELQRACSLLEAERNRANERNAQLERKVAALTERLNERDAADAAAAAAAAQQRDTDDDCDRLAGCRDDDGSSKSHGSAESASIPLPQENREESINIPATGRRSVVAGTRNSSNSSSSPSTTAALLKIIALCLLYRSCSSSSTLAGSKSWPRACSPMSAQTWQTLLRRAARDLPRMKAPRSECLDQWWGPTQQSWNPPQIAAI